jgi:signal transduction histidine kinase
VEQFMSQSKAQFKFSTDILRRLGEELNPNPDQGILELVKNAYDADAINCSIELLNTINKGGTIHITDDGHGMDIDEIKNGWLLLGKSSKNFRITSALGRIPAGSKGLGRLAALRMGRIATLITRPKSQPGFQHKLSIDWSFYDKANIVEDVELFIDTIQINPKIKPGTEIFIEDLLVPIDRSEIKRLSRNLILLADPFGDNPVGFKPSLIAPEFEDLEKLVEKRYFSDADYYLHAEINKEGFAFAEVKDWKGQILFSADHANLTAGRLQLPYQCPPAKFDIWIFLLDAGNFSTRSTTIGEVREWLREFGGVHLYENDLRVAPYGNPGNDWLDLNLKRARSPEERPSTNTVIGRVSISNKKLLLLQKTDRSGFIEGDAFSELRLFAQDSMEWLANRRMDIALQRRVEDQTKNKQQTRRTKSQLENIVDQVPSSVKADLQLAINAYDRSRDKEVRDLKKEVQLYRTLSTAGITSVTFAHESSGNPIKVITQSILAIERRSSKEIGDKYDALLKKPVEGIKKSLDTLSFLGSATLRLVDHEKRRIGRVELNKTIEDVLDTFKPFFDGRDVQVEKEFCRITPYIRASEAAVESIITNLINNSLTAFESSDVQQRKMFIRTSVENNIFTLRVIDNGPGIKGINLKDIWLPGKSTRPNGTGLGLCIVRDTVMDLGGKVDARAKSEFGGAEIIVQIPLVGV